MQEYKLKSGKKETSYVVILSVIFVLLQGAIIALGRYGMEVFRGVLSAFQYGVCLLMLAGKRKASRNTAIILMALSLTFVSIASVRGTPGSLPGLFNGLFYLLTLILISHFNEQRDLENRTDMITGAYNRKGLYIELEERVRKNRNFSIIYLYLDNFKAINDGYGHAYGDELLRKIMKRMNMKFGKDCSIARLGSSEFVMCVDGNKNVKDISERLLETLSEKSILVVDDIPVDCYVSCYAGISEFPKDAEDYESLIKHADIAMLAAKEDKSKETYFFNDSMLEKMTRQNYVEKLIKDGLPRKRFFLMYQPQFEIDHKTLRGFEVLLRMKSKTGEVVSPNEFIPIAERSDLIYEIDDYVLSNAMEEFQEIIAARHDLTVSINVSAKDFASKGFVEKIQSILSDKNFPAKNLEIEITEYCMVTSMEITLSNIQQLRAMGVKIALDDFGTGYSSLDYVSRLPLDLLKIDKSLVDDIEKDRKRRELVHAVINMGQLIECAVIAEGVENNSQIEFLREYDCDFIQGFVWGKPLPFDTAKELVLQ